MPAPPPLFHPEAEDGLAELRAMLAARASPEEIAQWIKSLSAAVNNPPDQNTLDLRIPMIVRTLGGRLPACAWTTESLDEAARKFRFFPSIAEIAEHLEPYRTDLLADIEQLERIAKAPRSRPDPPRESTTPYRPTATPPAKVVSLGPMTADELRDGNLIQPPARTVEQQLRALGYGPDNPPPPLPKPAEG